MKVKVSFPRFFFTILAFSIGFIILASSFFNVLYDPDFYSNEFKKNGVVDKIDNPELKSGEIVRYFSDDSGIMFQNPIIFGDEEFSLKELEHLQDVKVIISNFRTLYVIFFTIFVVLLIGFISTLFMKYSELKVLKEKIVLFLAKLSGWSVLVELFILTLFGIFIFFMFDQVFIRFHEILFPQGNWTFPTDSLLIMLFPQGFFSDFIVKVLILSLRLTVMLGVLFGVLKGLSVLNSGKKTMQKKTSKKNGDILDSISSNSKK